MATLASDGTSADVATKLAAANSGDIVTIPSGTFSWTAKCDAGDVAANVTLQGAGTSATGGGNQTTITDDYDANDKLLNVGINSSGTFRMTGITVQSGAALTISKDGGTVVFNGPGNLRIDHCRFNSTSSKNYKTILLGAGVFGVMNQCILDFWGTNCIYVYNARQGPGSDTQGNYEWTQPTSFGGADYFFIEECIINGDTTGSVYDTRIFDGFTGAKVVVRFNDVSQAVLGETHATGHAGDDRGLRSQEIYGNEVTSSLAKDPNLNATRFQNGTGLIWGNTWDNVYKGIYSFRVQRQDNTTYTQSATPAGWGYAGTDFNGTGSDWDGGTLNATDTVYGYPCLDQPGRGAGDLLTGSFSSKTNDTTGTIAWPDQALEPIYIWNNSGDFVSGWGGSEYGNSSPNRIVSDRDYYAQASGIQTSASSPFDGTTGTGWGTLANRPTTCTVGVAYWATDQGTWNESSTNPYGVQQNGANGVLYVCETTDVWTEHYTPYTYPHPLRSEVISVPTAPTSLTLTAL